METLIIFAIVMLISSMVKPKKRTTNNKPANNSSPTQKGQQFNTQRPQTGRRKNIFEQLEDELRNLAEKQKKPTTQPVYKSEPKAKSFKQEVEEIIRKKEMKREPEPFLEDSFGYYTDLEKVEELSKVSPETKVIKKQSPKIVNLKQAIIMSEILDKPLYLRKRA